jgi:pSer/pThr/pTyr-binding forkhead associated (FHA) protein
MSASIVLTLRLVTALALFAFLVWAFYYLYREVQRQSFTIASRRVPGINIMVKDGSAGTTLRYFTQPEITIGRDPGSDIPLNDDTASARHAHLIYHHSQWWLEDIHSTNGTFLNDLPISMPTVITSGDEIRCGSVRLTVSLSKSVIIEPTQRVKKNG